jgi:hypothetical protein
MGCNKWCPDFVYRLTVEVDDAGSQDRPGILIISRL